MALHRPLDEPAAREATDFAGLTVLRLQLEGQRREVAEAVRRLDDEERRLLSLWWLEVAGARCRPRPQCLPAGLGRGRQGHRPGPPDGAVRHGLVRDTGKDDAPVPRYVTRKTPADAATVPQKPRV